jgi:hypothetical protein
MAKQKWYTFGRKRLYVQALIISPAFKVIIGKRKGETSNIRFVKYLVFYDDTIQAVKHNFIRSKNARCMQQATTNAGVEFDQVLLDWIMHCVNRDNVDVSFLVHQSHYLNLFLSL